MKKLKLDLDKVEVQSFTTTPELDDLLGTVEGAMVTWTRGCGTSCTCVASCCHTEDVDVAV